MSKIKMTDADAAITTARLVAEEEKKSHAKESNVKAEVIAYDDIYKQIGETYFRELRKYVNDNLITNQDDKGKFTKKALLTGLFNTILTSRLIFLQDPENAGKINDDNYIYGITIRMPIYESGGIDSCRPSSANDDFAIPNEYWSKLVEQYKMEMKGLYISPDTINMINIVACERGLCKDERWKSGLNKLIYCPGSSGSQMIYPWLQTGTKGGRTRKQKKHKRRTRKGSKRTKTRRYKK